MGNMQTERLYHSLPVFKIKNIVFVDILCVELLHLSQRKQLFGDLPLFFCRTGKFPQGFYRLFQKGIRNTLRLFPLFFRICSGITAFSCFFLLPPCFPDRF